MAVKSAKEKEFNPFMFCEKLPSGTRAGEADIIVPSTQQMDVNGDGTNDSLFIQKKYAFVCPSQRFLVSATPACRLTPQKDKPTSIKNNDGVLFQPTDIVTYNNKKYVFFEVPETQELILTKDGKPNRNAMEVVLIDYQGLEKQLASKDAENKDLPIELKIFKALHDNIVVTRLGNLKSKEQATTDSIDAAVFVDQLRSAADPIIANKVAHLEVGEDKAKKTKNEGPALKVPDDINEASACIFLSPGETSATTVSAAEAIPFDIDGDKKDDHVLKMKVIQHNCLEDKKDSTAQKTASFFRFATLPVKFMNDSGHIFSVGDTVKIGGKKFTLIGLDWERSVELDSKGKPIRGNIRVIVLDEGSLAKIDKIKNSPNAAKEIPKIIAENSQSVQLKKLTAIPGQVPIKMKAHFLGSALSNTSSGEYIYLMKFLSDAIKYNTNK